VLVLGVVVGDKLLNVNKGIEKVVDGNGKYWVRLNSTLVAESVTGLRSQKISQLRF